MNKPRVLISLPHTGQIHTSTVNAIEQLILPDQRVQLQVIRPSAVPFENNMNQVIQYCLQGDWDFWINLDSDQAPLKNPLDLVFLDKDVIGLPTPAVKFGQAGWENPFFWSVYRWDEKREAYFVYKYQPDQGPLQEVDAVGSGCWVVARRVLEALQHPLQQHWDEHGILQMGGDVSFCRKARAQGFRIFAHYDYPCRHFKTVDLYEVMKLLSREH